MWRVHLGSFTKTHNKNDILTKAVVTWAVEKMGGL